MSGSRREVELRLPGQLYGGDPRGLLRHLSLNGRRLGDEHWSVWPTPDEQPFIRCRNVADETEFTNNFDYLREVPNPSGALDDPDTLQRFSELEEQIAERMAGGSDISAVFHQIQADVFRSTNSDDLIAAVRDGYNYIGQMPYEVTQEPAFPQRGVTLVISTDLLIRRARLPAILFRFDQDPDALKTIAAIEEGEGGYFASSSPWYREIVGVIHYFGPLLGCLSPRFWCLPAGRPPCAVLFSFGRDINGLRNSPMEPMQLLPGFGRMEPAPSVEIAPGSYRQAIYWWTNRLNQMFRYLCDPTTFGNAHGLYDPYEHQHWLLTFGQVFGLTTALQTAGRTTLFSGR